MGALQLWFEPLLWIIGTITALAAFVRLCKPVWKFLTIPTQTIERLNEFEKKIDQKLTSLENRVEKLTKQNEQEDSITLSLLHDAIVQIYQQAKRDGFISEVDYYRACELYKQNGNSQYIDSIMTALTEMHGKGMIENV